MGIYGRQHPEMLSTVENGAPMTPGGRNGQKKIHNRGHAVHRWGEGGEVPLKEIFKFGC